MDGWLVTRRFRPLARRLLVLGAAVLLAGQAASQVPPAVRAADPSPTPTPAVTPTPTPTPPADPGEAPTGAIRGLAGSDFLGTAITVIQNLLTEAFGGQALSGALSPPSVRLAGSKAAGK